MKLYVWDIGGKIFLYRAGHIVEGATPYVSKPIGTIEVEEPKKVKTIETSANTRVDTGFRIVEQVVPFAAKNIRLVYEIEE